MWIKGYKKTSKITSDSTSGIFCVKLLAESDPNASWTRNYLRILQNAYLKKFLRKKQTWKLSFFGSFSHFLRVLIHESIQMTTDSDSSIDFLQIYVSHIYRIGDLGISVELRRKKPQFPMLIPIRKQNAKNFIEVFELGPDFFCPCLRSTRPTERDRFGGCQPSRSLHGMSGRLRGGGGWRKPSYIYMSYVCVCVCV